METTKPTLLIPVELKVRELEPKLLLLFESAFEFFLVENKNGRMRYDNKTKIGRAHV